MDLEKKKKKKKKKRKKRSFKTDSGSGPSHPTDCGAWLTSGPRLVLQPLGL